MSLEYNEKSYALRELDTISHFRAQVQLENDHIEAYLKKIVGLKLDDNLDLEYAKLQGAIEALRKLQGARKQIIAT